MSEKNQILKSIETSLAVVSSRKDSIIEMRFKFETYEVDVKEIMELRNSYSDLSQEGKVPCHLLVIPGKYGSVSKEAREIEMFEGKPYNNLKSLNIVVNSLSQRLLAKLYMSLKKKKPVGPYKFYESEAKAVEWIKNN